MGDEFVYDCLTPPGLAIARQLPTPEEEASVQFDLSIPRGKDAGLVHNLAHRLMGTAARLSFDCGPAYSPLGRTLVALRRPQVGRLAWEFSRRTTGLWSRYRFLHLHRLITRLKPKTVIEFGTGVSTVLIAEMLRANHLRHGVKGKLVSYEQASRYYEQYAANFPKELAEYAEFHLRPVALEWYGPYRGIYYDIDDFPKEVDFVYIDGATRTRGCPECDFSYHRLNADLVRMVRQGTQVKMAVTDHRYANFPFYARELGSRYKVKLSKTWRSIVVTPR